MSRIVIFRIRADKAEYIYREMKEGRLRQGWGAPGLELCADDGTGVTRERWEENCRRLKWEGEPSAQRFTIMRRLLDIQEGDMVVVPKLSSCVEFSNPCCFTVAVVSGKYKFCSPQDDELADLGHIIPIDPCSVRTFHQQANSEADRLSGSSLKGYWDAVIFSGNEGHVQAVPKLLREPRDCLEPKEDLDQAILDEATTASAEAMMAEVRGWNAKKFERVVRQAFRNQGYEDITANYRRYTRKGGDVDAVFHPPSNSHSWLVPQKIAVQIKWKQGRDEDDGHAVEQLVRWREIESAQKVVISSADEFTEECVTKAREHGVILIGGLDAMCFLMGLAGRIRRGE